MKKQSRREGSAERSCSSAQCPAGGAHGAQSGPLPTLQPGIFVCSQVIHLNHEFYWKRALFCWLSYAFILPSNLIYYHKVSFFFFFLIELLYFMTPNALQ